MTNPQNYNAQSLHKYNINDIASTRSSLDAPAQNVIEEIEHLSREGNKTEKLNEENGSKPTRRIIRGNVLNAET